MIQEDKYILLDGLKEKYKNTLSEEWREIEKEKDNTNFYQDVSLEDTDIAYIIKLIKDDLEDKEEELNNKKDTLIFDLIDSIIPTFIQKGSTIEEIKEYFKNMFNITINIDKDTQNVYGSLKIGE